MDRPYLSHLLLDLKQLARVLGGDVVDGQVLCPGPGHSPRDRSLAVRPSAQSPFGFIAYSHAGDDWRTYRGYVLEKLGLPHSDASRGIRRSQRPPQPDCGFSDAERTARALELWHEAGPLGRIALDYFASRAIPELPLPDINGVLRFHSRCPFGPGERHPCIIALLRNVIADVPQAIHRTALTMDGLKLERKALGLKAGAAIKLWPDEEVAAGLVIGEGLETTLSAAARVKHCGTLLRPAWAAIDTGNLAKFPVLTGVQSLTVLVDNDQRGQGQAAARECARRWVAADREAVLLTPRLVGADFNDVILGAVS